MEVDGAPLLHDYVTQAMKDAREDIASTKKLTLSTQGRDTIAAANQSSQSATLRVPTSLLGTSSASHHPLVNVRQPSSGVPTTSSATSGSVYVQPRHDASNFGFESARSERSRSATIDSRTRDRHNISLFPTTNIPSGSKQSGHPDEEYGGLGIGIPSACARMILVLTLRQRNQRVLTLLLILIAFIQA